MQTESERSYDQSLAQPGLEPRSDQGPCTFHYTFLEESRYECVCEYLCISECANIYAHDHVCTYYGFVGACSGACMCESACVHECSVCTCVHIFECGYGVCVYGCMQACVYICIFV